ncbi:hypothetical protein JCM10213_003097 [Rhodosporidiobolus nylandii]
MAVSPVGSEADEGAAGVLEQVLEILEDTCDDLSPCGPAVTSLLPRLFSHLNAALSLSSPSAGPSNPVDAALTLSASLLRLSDEKLNSFPYKDVPLHWRRLYTDASLLGCIARLACLDVQDEGARERERESAETAVRELDMVLVIAGAPGEGREELIFALMEVAQERLRALLPLGAFSSSPPPAKKRRLSPPPRLARPYIHRPLPSLPSLPSRLSPSPPGNPPTPFVPEGNPHDSPFVIRGGASSSTGWPAVEHWKELRYLVQKAGPGRVVPVEIGGDYTKEGWGQRIMPFSEFLASLSPSPSPSADSSPHSPPLPTYYLAQHSLFRQFPSLLSDLTVPDLVYSAPTSDGAGESYEGVSTADGYIMNAWLGPGGTKSAAHTDPWWNCYVQVTGSKWVWVAPPCCSSSMAAFGASSSPSSPPSSPSAAPPSASEKAEQYMSNTSSLDVTVPPPLPLQSSAPGAPPPTTDGEAAAVVGDGKGGYYPREWLQQVEPLARQVVLEAGDVLVMPPRWWHAMQSLETSFSVSIWF